jgi:hypothetical protein
MSPESTSETPMGEFGRLTGVFFSPRKAFADIASRPRWWVPLLLLVLATTAFTVTYSKRVGWERFMRRTLETNPRMQNLPPEQREQAIERAAGIASITGTAGAIVGGPVFYLVTAGVLLLVFKMMGQTLRFQQAFAISCYAFLTGLVSSALAIAMMFLTEPDDFDLRNPVALNLGFFLDPQSSPKWLVSLGTSLDLMSFWTMALLATGFSVAGRNLSWSKAFAGVVMPWLILVLLKVGWTAMFG